MTWITNIDLGESKDRKEAYKIAKDTITQWGKENNIKCEIHHNTRDSYNTKHNRVLVVETKNLYTYKMIVKQYRKVIGQEKDLILSGLFGKEKMHDVFDNDPTYYVVLQRFETTGIGSKTDNKEILN